MGRPVTRTSPAEDTAGRQSQAAPVCVRIPALPFFACIFRRVLPGRLSCVPLPLLSLSPSPPSPPAHCADSQCPGPGFALRRGGPFTQKSRRKAGLTAPALRRFFNAFWAAFGAFWRIGRPLPAGSCGISVRRLPPLPPGRRRMPARPCRGRRVLHALYLPRACRTFTASRSPLPLSSGPPAGSGPV